MWTYAIEAILLLGCGAFAGMFLDVKTYCGVVSLMVGTVIVEIWRKDFDSWRRRRIDDALHRGAHAPESH